MKACAICKETKSFDDFSPGKNGKPHSYCKPCYKTWAHENYLKTKEKRLAAQRQRREDDPDRVRAIEAKSQVKNKAKRKKASAEWARRNPDKRKQYARTWRAKNKEMVVDASHRRRAKIRRATIGRVTKQDLKALLRNPCIYCGAKAEQIDHVIPLARGGPHSVGNLAPSCRFCNQSKKDHLVIEWKALKRDIRNHLHV